MKRFSLYAILLLIILLGFMLRVYRLDAIPLRGDEAFSVQRWAAIPLPISLTEIAAIEPHPPLTYVLFRGWGLLFGVETVFSLRMFPVLLNLLGIPALFAIGKRLTGKTFIGLLAAFFWAIHPFQIWHAQDFRNYGIWAGLSAIVVYLGLRIIWGQSNWRIWLLYCSIASVSCLIFYDELLTIGVLGLLALSQYKNWRFVLRWSLVNAGIIAVTFAAFIVFQGNLLTGGGYGGTTGGFEVWQWWERFLPVLTLGDTLSLSLRQQFNPYTDWWWIVVIGLSFTWLVVFWKSRKHAGFLLLLGIVPLIILGLISIRLQIFRPRYVLLSAPAYTLTIVYAIWILWHVRLGKWLATGIFVGYLSLIVISLNNYYFDPNYRKAPEWDALANYLEENTVEGEAIIQTGVDPAFGYYYDLADIAAGEFGLPADVTQPIPEIIRTMESTAHDYHSIWIVGQTFPDWQNAGVVENWALENLQLVRDTRIAGLPVRHFLGWNVLDSEVSQTVLADFGNVAQLVGMRIFETEANDELSVWLYWKAEAQSDAPLKIFVHLVGNINPATATPLWSQDDQAPQNGRIETNIWELGQVYRDVYVLPLDGVETGDYSLLVGLYDPLTNERLVLEDGSDAYTIDTVSIKQ